MRWLLAAIAIPFTLAVSPVCGETQFPYKAHITADEVYVRSGPGQSYYPTDKLKAGQEIEVYRHDPGGWYAIRPPQGSFSWVSRRYLEPAENGLEKVIGDRVAARVGSRFSEVREVIQVRLEKDELVEVLPADNVAQDPTGQAWTRIAPPSGEFRWVFGKFVDRNYATSGIRTTHAADNRKLLSKSDEPSELAMDEEEESSEPEPAEVQQASFESSADDEPIEEAMPADEVEPASFEEPARLPVLPDEPKPLSPVDEKEDVVPTQHQQPVDAPQGIRIPEPTISPQSRLARREDWSARAVSPTEANYDEAFPYATIRRDLSSEEFRNNLDELEMELSTMLAEEPTVWQFDALKQRADALMAQSETAIERGLARRVVQKIARFDDIKSRYDKVNAVRREADRSEQQMAAVQPSVQQAVAPRATNPRFDGVGQLTQVVPPKLGAPRYALLDAEGNVNCYVSPVPGVNLSYYLGRWVGVNGSRGYMPERQAQHVMARHVSLVSGATLR